MRKSISEVINYYYYRYVELHTSLLSFDDAYSASFIFYWIALTYIYSIISIVLFLCGTKIPNLIWLIVFYGFSSLFVCNLFNEEKYQKCKLKYVDEEKRKRRRRDVYLICFILGSLPALALPYIIALLIVLSK